MCLLTLFDEIEAKFYHLENKINKSKKIEFKYKNTEDDLYRFASDESFFISSINLSRNQLLVKVKNQLKHDLDFTTNKSRIVPSVLKINHEKKFSLLEFVTISYEKDISIEKKLRYIDLFNFSKLTEYPNPYRNKNNLTFYPVSNFRFLIHDSELNQLLLLMADGCLVKRLKLPCRQYCQFHVYESKIFWVSCNLDFEDTLIQVLDLNLNILGKKKIEPGYIYFFNANFINFCNQKNEHHIYDTNLKQILTLKDIYRNPLINVEKNRLMFLENEINDLYLKINFLKEKKLIEKIKINTLSSFSYIIDEDSNIYVRMMNSADCSMYIFCFDLNGKFLFKKNLPNLQDFHAIKLISSNQIALFNNQRNSLVII